MSQRMEPEELDNAAYHLAALSRERRDTQHQISLLPQTYESLQDIQSAEKLLITKLSDLSTAYKPLLDVILKETEFFAKQFASQHRIGLRASDEFCLRLKGKVFLSIHQFRKLDDEKKAGKIAKSYFIAWLRQVAFRERIDVIREGDRGSAKTLMAKQTKYWQSLGLVTSDKVQLVDAGQIETINERKTYENPIRLIQNDSSTRDFPKAFHNEDEIVLSQLSDDCRSLFIYSTGMWGFLSATKLDKWINSPCSPYELKNFSSLDRANRWVLFQTELAIKDRKVAADESEDSFETMHRKVANRAAQNLLRHFWKYMKINTAWQYLFQNIEPFSKEQLDDFATKMLPSPQVFVSMLLFDVYLIADTSERCFSWLDEYGITNTLDANIGRILAKRAFIGDRTRRSTIELNSDKWDACCLLMGINSIGLEPEAFIRSGTGNAGMNFVIDQTHRIAKLRDLLDLPIPFQSITSRPQSRLNRKPLMQDIDNE